MIDLGNYTLPRDRDPEFFQLKDNVVIFLGNKDTLPLRRNTFTGARVVGKWRTEETGEINIAVDPGKPTSKWDGRIPHQEHDHGWPMFDIHSAHVMKLEEWNRLMRNGISEASRFLRSGSAQGDQRNNTVIMQAFFRTGFGMEWHPMLPQERDPGVQPAEVLLPGDPVIVFTGDGTSVPSGRRKTLVAGTVMRTDESSVFVVEENGMPDVTYAVPYSSPFIFGRWTYERLREQHAAAAKSNEGKVFNLANDPVESWVMRSTWPQYYGYGITNQAYAKLLIASFDQFAPVDCSHYFILD